MRKRSEVEADLEVAKHMREQLDNGSVMALVGGHEEYRRSFRLLVGAWDDKIKELLLELNGPLIEDAEIV